MDTQTTPRLSIHAAVIEEKHEVVETWIKIDNRFVNSQDPYGNTPLHCSAYIGNLSIVKLLLKHEANLFAKNASHNTPLDLIFNKLPRLSNQHYETIKFLLKKIPPEQLTALRERDTSLLHLVIYHNNIEMIRLFFMYGANPNAINSEGHPAWYNQYHEPEILSIFFKHPNIDLSFFQKHNKTILFKILKGIQETTLKSKTDSLDPNNPYVQSLKYLIFSVAIDEAQGRTIFEQSAADCLLLMGCDLPIVDIIKKALAIKQKAETELHQLGVAPLLIRHSLLFFGDAHQTFLDTVKLLLEEHNNQESLLFKLPREILNQIIEALVSFDEYRFPHLDSGCMQQDQSDALEVIHTITFEQPRVNML